MYSRDPDTPPPPPPPGFPALPSAPVLPAPPTFLHHALILPNFVAIPSCFLNFPRYVPRFNPPNLCQFFFETSNVTPPFWFTGLPANNAQVLGNDATTTSTSIITSNINVQTSNSCSEFQLLARDFPPLPCKTASASSVEVPHYESETVSSTPSLPSEYSLKGLLNNLQGLQGHLPWALGEDLTKVGIDLKCEQSVSESFSGPFADYLTPPQYVDYPVPREYLINNKIRHQLPPFSLSSLSEEVLFYLFYTHMGDLWQIAAASILFDRQWRYHIDYKVWVSHIDDMIPEQKTNTHEVGLFYYFDVVSWTKLKQYFFIQFSKLQDRPLPREMF